MDPSTMSALAGYSHSEAPEFSFVAQAIDRIEVGRHSCGIVAEEQAHSDGDRETNRYPQIRNSCGNRRHECADQCGYDRPYKDADSTSHEGEDHGFAGPTISLAAAVLRSSRLEILGAGSGNAVATPEIWIEAIRQLMSNIGCGTLRIDTERVPLCEVEIAWHQEQYGRRAVIIP